MAEKKEKKGPSVAKERTDVLKKLREMADERFTQDDIAHEGTRMVIPRRMTKQTAVKVLEESIKQEETKTDFSRTFDYRPWDGAAAFERAVMFLTGTLGIQRSTRTMFGEVLPARVTVPTSATETMDVPWGQIRIELFEADAFLGSTRHVEYGMLFQLNVEAPRKYQAEINVFFGLIQEELGKRSIYRGKAFDGQENPEFLDLRGLDPSQVIYSDAVMEQLNANVWSLPEHAAVMREMGLPLKRAVLLEGPFGTGKTLAMYLTALKAIQNNWTFVYCRPGKDDLLEVIQTARLYQPAVVAIEDVDTVANSSASDGETRDRATQVLDIFDGINAKGTELLVVLTTNHVELIYKGMMRPGRLDAVIRIAELDLPGTQRMVEAVVPASERADDLDYEAIYAAMEGFMPAFVKESIDRARRHALVRTGRAGSVLATSDLVHAGEGLRAHLSLMESAKEGTNLPTLDAVYRENTVEVVQELLDRSRLVADNGEGGPGDFKIEVQSVN